MKYDLLVFIGRFQPLHLGHSEVIERARSLSDNVLVLVGSANSARSARNSFTYDERAKMIKAAHPFAHTRALNDHTYNDSAWIMEVQQIVNAFVDKHIGVKKPKIGLIGCEKDHTSYYLKMFPDWGNEGVHYVNPLNATAIRQVYFNEWMERYQGATIMNTKTFDFLERFMETKTYTKLKSEYEYLKAYKEKYGEGPHLTADTLVQVGGKILLIERGKEYGHGLTALPGGFVHPKTETFKTAAFRELREETRLKVPLPVLHGSIVASETFDDPHRSARGRLVTQVFHVKLENDTSLPEVRGGDDADKAKWVDLAWVQANPDKFFEDHYHIIKKMLGL